jgi:hypothetical protein
MPSLEGVTVKGAAKVTIAGFNSDKDCKLQLSGTASLKGDLQAATVDLEVVGGANVTVSLKGSAKKLKLSAHGANNRLELGGMAVERADVTLTGVCDAEIQVKNELDYELSGTSHLRYAGEPKLGRHRATGASRATASPR